MLARIIKDLSGLGIEEEEEVRPEEQLREVRATSGASPPRHADAAHLSTASACPSPPPAASSPPQPLSARWSAFVGGARDLLDNLIDLGDSDDEPPDSELQRSRRQHQQQQPSTPGYPTVAGAEDEDGEEPPEGTTTAPALLCAPDDQPVPQMSEPSGLMEERHVRALAAEVPARYRQCRWELAYSTQRDGISLQTLLRNGRGRAPTVLVVRDMGRHVFGAYCSEAWRLAPRHFGTGETFVFQLAPRQAVWHWWWRKMGHTQNDFFMWGEKGAIAVGGAGGYALWLDEELARGLSRCSITFGNSSLASAEEFAVGAVELWWLR